MLLRFRSSQGTFRLEFTGQEPFINLHEKVLEHLKLPNTANLTYSIDQLGKNIVTVDPNVSLIDQGLSHGDLIFLHFNKTDLETYKSPSDIKKIKVIEDKVDIELDGMNGMIKRNKDQKFCKHSANGMCDYCMPLEPYDPGYLAEKGIKHMSFHSYLRKLYPKHKRGSNNFDSFTAPLEEPDYKVKTNCSGGHAPWPESICTKCQPSAITLQRQTFRYVDHVEFASTHAVDNFIRFWRTTGCQRFGYLLGSYESYTEVPLGIKAVVEAIYEPPQQNSADELQVDFSEEAETALHNTANLFNLKIVGIIYTDLVDKGQRDGKVISKRHIDSYFLSSQECHFSAAMQRKYPNPCRFSKSGKFGSKFVTCIVSGNSSGDIDVSAYQMSDAASAMVEADIIQPSVQPEKMLVKGEEEDGKRYVPEIFYKFKNEYGVTVKQNAIPSFPVEYLIVNVTHGFPSQPKPKFQSTESFPISNRAFESGSLPLLKQRVDKLEDLTLVLSDFDVLLFIKSTDIFSDEEFKLLIEAATTHSDTRQGIYNQLLQTPGWATLQQLFEEASLSGDAAANPSGSGTGGEMWSCHYCTFTNIPEVTDCEMCSLPRS